MGADHTGVLLALAAALLLWSPAEVERRRRARRVAGGGALTAGHRGGRRTGRSGAGPVPAGRPWAGMGPWAGGVARRRAAAAVVGFGIALLVGGPTGVAAGLAAAAGALWALRRGPAGPGARPPDVAAALPVACDLLAVCLAAGVPLEAALAAVATAVPTPLDEQLRGVAALYRLGADPGRAWAAAAAECQPLGRILIRAGESGSAVGPALRALAAELRSEARSTALARVQRAGVWVLAPLGACFLPAFLCLGVVPLVLGIARNVFG